MDYAGHVFHISSSCALSLGPRVGHPLVHPSASCEGGEEERGWGEGGHRKEGLFLTQYCNVFASSRLAELEAMAPFFVCL